MKIIKYSVKLIISYLFLFIANISSAQSLITPERKNGSAYETGDYKLNDFVELIIRASDLILRFVGSLALLFFIYGGLMFLLSSGNTEQVNKAKGIIKAAVIGLIIVFTSFLIISFVLSALNVDWDGSFINI